MKVLVQRVENSVGGRGINTFFYQHDGPWPHDPIAALGLNMALTATYPDESYVPEPNAHLISSLEVVFPNQVLEGWVYAFVVAAVDAVAQIAPSPSFMWRKSPGALRFWSDPTQVLGFGEEFKELVRHVLVP